MRAHTECRYIRHCRHAGARTKIDLGLQFAEHEDACQMRDTYTAPVMFRCPEDLHIMMERRGITETVNQDLVKMEGQSSTSVDVVSGSARKEIFS